MSLLTWFAFIVHFCLGGSFVEGQILSKEFDLRPYYYVLLPCNNASGATPALPSECIAFYNQTNPFLADTIPESGDTLGAISFNALFTGKYTITVAGASGGRGVCSRLSGRGYMFTTSGIPLDKGDRLTVRVGQQGTSACDTNSSHPICILDPSDGEFQTKCEMLRADETFRNDGGGGGGGFSDVLRSTYLLTAGGGGGAPAFDGPQSGRNVSDATPPMGAATSMNGNGSTGSSAGAGGGSEAGSSNYIQDGNFLRGTGMRDLGGQDCLVSMDPSVFPSTVGGFGSGGGGCGNGGGGGGYQGGSVVSVGDSFAGHGGQSFASFPVVEVTNSSFNIGDGFVTVFFETCECSGNCVPDFDGMTFQCKCPNSTMLSASGKDCITDDVPSFSSVLPPETLTVFSQSVNTQLLEFPYSLLVYDLEAEFNGTTTRTFEDEVTNLSDLCVILLLQGVSVVGASEMVRIGDVRTSRLISRMTESGFSPYSSSNGSNPIKASAIEVVGVSATCQVSLSWNVSIVREPNETVRSVRFQLNEILPQLFEACSERNDSCQTLVVSPSSIPRPLDLIVIATLSTLGGAGTMVICLLILLGCVYYRYRKKKVYVTVSNVKTVPNFFRPHYENLECDPQMMEPLVHAYENTDEAYVFQYVNEQDTMYDRLKELRPKHGVESQPVTSITRDSDELECNRQDLIFIKKIGEGKYGEIILMKTKNLYGCLNVPVAVKALSRSVEEMKDRFFAEIELLQGVHHPNIVHLFGYCIDSYNTSSLEAPPLMILEYMALGDLLNILIANKPKEGVVSNLETKHLFSFAADIARALLYLSEQNYVHRDVAARNVLVAQNLTAKLTDFRLTQKVDENGQYQLKESGSLPIRWMSPESLLDGIYSVHTDCWAYGVLLWEMVTYGEFPHEISDMIKVTEAAENKQLRVIPPHGCHRVLASVIEECQSHEPEMRPTFQSLIDSITITLENFNSNVESTAV